MEDTDSNLHPEMQRSPSGQSTFSFESNPSQLTFHDDDVDPLNTVKRAIDISNDKICDLQDSLIENKNRLTAILGIGAILEKTHGKRNRLASSGIPRCPSSDSKDSEDRISLFHSNVAEMTKLIMEDSHSSERMKILVAMINQQLEVQSLANIAGSPNDPERKERKLQVDHLRRDLSKLEIQLAERNKHLLEKSGEINRLTAELNKCTMQSTSRNNDVVVLQAHVKGMEKLLHSVTSELVEPISAAIIVANDIDDSDLFSHNSVRFMSMIAQLSQLRTTVKSKNSLSRAEYLELEASRTQQIESLTAQLAQCGASCHTLKGEKEALSKKVTQLEQSLTEKVKVEHEVIAAHRNNNELLAMSKELAVLRKQNKDLQEQLAQHHAIYSTKIAGLTANLVHATEESSNYISAKTVENKHSEKLIASLEASLDANRKELSLVHSHNVTLEAKIAELHKQIQEKKTFVKGMEGEDLATLRKELHNKTQEVLELRDRNTELAVANATYLEQVIQTENSLNTEIVELKDHIANLHLEQNVECDDLRRQVAQLNQMYYSTTAREAEKKVAFTKESLRAHLKANGVKVFHWEDMATLIQKVEDLHNKPNQPVVTVADLAEMVDVEGSDLSQPPTPTLQHKKSMLKSVKSMKGLLLKVNTASSHSGNSIVSPGADSFPDNISISSAQLRTPNSAKSFRFDSSARSVTSETRTPSKVWNPAKVEKNDPFGDQKKSATASSAQLKATGSSKDLLVEKMDLLKKQSSVQLKSAVTSAKNSKSGTAGSTATSGATPKNKKTVKVVTTPAASAGGSRNVAKKRTDADEEEEEEVKPYDDESDTF